MALRIEKAWGSIVGIGEKIVRRRDSGENATSDERGKDRGQQDAKQEENNPPPEAVDRQSVEKAVAELKASQPFNQSGLRLEMIEGPNGISVRLTQSSGALVKVMTAEEFLRLKENSTTEQPRGKILDQKF